MRLRLGFLTLIDIDHLLLYFDIEHKFHLDKVVKTIYEIVALCRYPSFTKTLSLQSKGLKLFSRKDHRILLLWKESGVAIVRGVACLRQSPPLIG
jgi:hypothetical protein